jgi:hypothetical protein
MFIHKIKPQFVYISNTKSASSSVYAFLKRHFSNSKQSEIHSRPFKTIPEEYASFPWFTVVRHPYQRLSSWWWSAVKMQEKIHKDRYGHIKELRDMGLDTRFSNFLKLWATKPQTKQTIVIKRNNGRIPHIIHVENIEKELSELPFLNQHIKLFRLEHINHKKDRPEWKDVIKGPAIGLLHEVYQEDFDTFGYEKTL